MRFAAPLGRLRVTSMDSARERACVRDFEGIVVQVAAIEQTFGIYDLDQFTPLG